MRLAISTTETLTDLKTDLVVANNNNMLVFMSVCCSDCVGVCGNDCCVAAVAGDGVFNIGVLKHVVCL